MKIVEVLSLVYLHSTFPSLPLPPSSFSPCPSVRPSLLRPRLPTLLATSSFTVLLFFTSLSPGLYVLFPFPSLPLPFGPVSKPPGSFRGMVSRVFLSPSKDLFLEGTKIRVRTPPRVLEGVGKDPKSSFRGIVSGTSPQRPWV